MNPPFIVFEGIEGAGKTTLVKRLDSYLRAKGHTVYVTREPGGTRVADGCRALLLAHHEEAMRPETELCLLAAARAQHVHVAIRPALLRGSWVLCDRFTDSSLAYQGYGRQIPLEVIRALNALVCQGLQPDCVFVFDLDPRLGLERISGRHKDRIESESVDFFEKVRAGYQEIAKSAPYYHLLDAQQSVDALFEQMLVRLEPWI